MFYGIDIGGTKIELAAYEAYDGQLNQRYCKRIATPNQDYAGFITAITDLVTDTDQHLQCRGAVGLGLPGIVDSSGRQLSSNVPSLSGHSVTADLQQALARPVAQGNDCQCFALSEANGGAAKDAHSMFGAILGTGAGGGFCVYGQLIGGYNRLAGEWGHSSLPARLQLQYDLPLYPCKCGLSACLERYVSGSGLNNIYHHFKCNSMAEQVSAPEIIQRAEQGESHAVQAMACYIDVLAYGLAGLILHYDPHVIVLGGGMSQAASLYQKLPQAVARHIFSTAQVPPIVPPFFGDAGGTRGAAILAQQHHA